MNILCYHAVEPAWRSPMAIDPEAFETHCAWLGRHKTVLPLEQAIDRLDRRGRLPRGCASLTFDDGFASLHEHGLPVLNRHRLPATVFLVAATLGPGGREVDWVDRPPPYRLRTLTEAQVHEMQEAGVRFESHSNVHADLTGLTFDDCVRDLRDSRDALAEILRHPVRLLAYPRGRHNEMVRQAAARAGYTHALALPEGPEPIGAYAVPRVGVHHGNTVMHLRAKTARQYLPARTSRGYAWARRVAVAARSGTTGRRP